MEHSSDDRQAEHGVAVPIGPAVSPRRPPAGTPLGALAEPLPPFVRPGLAPASPPRAPEAEEPSLAEVLEEMVAGDPEDGVGLVRGADRGLPSPPAEAPAGGGDVRPEDAPVDATPTAAEVAAPAWSEAESVPEEAPATGHAAEGDASAAPAPPGPAGAAWGGATPAGGAESAPPMESGAAEALEEWALAASVESEGAEPVGEGPAPASMAVEPGRESAAPAPRPEAALAEAMSLEEGPALQEVAGRLERIAGALREGRPIELFSSGSSDPLEVLIAGYALGYSEAFRRVSEERRKGQ